MRPSFTYTTDLNKIATVDDVLAELARHEHVLAGTDIGQLIYFSRTYAITNRNINLARASGYFSNPLLIMQLQTHFAHIYFETLNDYAKTGSMSRQWRWASSHRLINFRSAGLSLFLAIRAHIQCDAAVALRRLSPDPSLFAQDYFRVETLFLASSREIVGNYNPDPRLQVIRELARKVVIIPMSLIIFRWRKQAWRNVASVDRTSFRKHDMPSSEPLFCGRLY